jgi:hypothetical protein
MVSFERLSIMTEYNPIGSLSSLGRMSAHSIKRTRSNSIRRGSYSMGMFKTSQDASKVDLLKSALEVNNSRTSNSSLKKSSSIISRHGTTSNSKVSIGADLLIIRYYSQMQILMQIVESRMPSLHKLNQKSPSLTPVADIEDKCLIPDETEEIIYDSIKSGEAVRAET